MSFSRAKLQRFNDTPSCAPPPGAYDPKVGNKVKGAIVVKKERFAKPKSTADLSEGSSGSDRAVPNCLPLIRTPVSQRKQAVKELSYNRATGHGYSGKEGHSKQSADQNVTIQDLETQVRTLQTRISQLEHEIRTLQECRQHSEEEFESQMNDLVQELERQSLECSALREQLTLSESQLEHWQKLCSDLELNYMGQKEKCERHTQENNQLQSRVAVLENQSKCKENVKETSAAFLSDLQELARASSMVHQLEERIQFLETEKHSVEKKLVTKQNMIISLQSELSSATLELEEMRLEIEKLASNGVLERREHEREVEWYKITLCDFENNVIEERKRCLTPSGSSEAQISTLQLEVQQVATVYEEEMKTLQQKQEAYVRSLLDENMSVMESKDDTTKAFKDDIELYQTKLADQQSELVNWKLHKSEVDHIEDKRKENLTKLFSENALVKGIKEHLIKCLQDDVGVMETKLADQQHELCALKLTHEIELGRIKKMHEEDVDKLLHEHASILAFKEDVILSLQRSKADIEVKLADTEHELDNVVKMYEKIAKCVREVNMDDVNIILRETAVAMESKEHLVKAQRETIAAVGAELECKQRELCDVKVRRGRELEQIQAAHKEEVNKVSIEKAAIIAAKEAALLTLQGNLRDIEAKLLCKEREVEDLKISQMEKRLTIIELQDAIDTLTVGCDAVKAELVAVGEKLQCKEKECWVLEVSRRNTHESVEALKARLLETEDDVQQLTADNCTLFEEKRRLAEDYRDLQEKLEREKVSIDCMEKEMKFQIECVKSSLLAKLEEFKMVAKERERVLYEADQKKQKELDSLGDLESFWTQLEIMNKNIRALECRNNKQDGELVSKEREISDLKEKLVAQECLLASATERNDRLTQLLETREKSLLEEEMSVKWLKAGKDSQGQLLVEHEPTSGPEEKALQCAELVEIQETHDRCSETAGAWEQRARELESLVGPFREQLEAFEAERRAMQQSQRATQQELRQLALQYAGALGHQNHQQKIKYLVQLRDHNLTLKQDKERLEVRLKQQKRVMDKLKEELAAMQGKHGSARGKENHPATSPLRQLPNWHQ